MPNNNLELKTVFPSMTVLTEKTYSPNKSQALVKPKTIPRAEAMMWLTMSNANMEVVRVFMAAPQS